MIGAETRLVALPRIVYEPIVRGALREDLGDAGDVTSRATIPAGTRAKATLRSRAAGRLAGLAPALCAFELLVPDVATQVMRSDGSDLAPGDEIATIEGDAAAILAGERTALNLLGRLSGIATLTAAYVRAVEPYPVAIACTRKTTPGLRALEKYAVRAGGGVNHRFGLYDAVLIKDNHVALAGGVTAAIAAARAHSGHLVTIEVEVDTLDQLREALEAGADAILLDNMTIEQLREAVTITDDEALLEASGGVTLDNVNAIASTGVDLISVGRLTHSAPALDIGLDIKR